MTDLNFSSAEVPSEEGASSGEGAEEGDRKEPLRFASLEVTSLEQSVPDHLIKTYDEVNKEWASLYKIQRKTDYSSLYLTF